MHHFKESYSSPYLPAYLDDLKIVTAIMGNFADPEPTIFRGSKEFQPGLLFIGNRVLCAERSTPIARECIMRLQTGL